MAFLKQPKVTYRTEKDIEDLKSKNDLLYVINGEIDQDKFVLLAESTKAGSLNIHLPILSSIRTFNLKPLQPTRIEIPIKDLKACMDLKYEFKFIPSEGNTTDDASTNYGSGRFTVPPKHGESWTYHPKIAILSCNEVTKDYTEDLKLWKAIENEQTDIKFLLGDQIYGDDVAFPMIDLDKEFVWESTYNLTQSAMKERYDDLYRITYHLCQTALRNGMNIMMPDDHEIYDTCGTAAFYDFNDQARTDAMIASYESFLEHQMALRRDPNENIYLHRKWGDIEYIGVDTRFDRFPAVWKTKISDTNKEYEVDPTWISKEQIDMINEVINNVEESQTKYLIVSTPTIFCPSSEWATKTVAKSSSEYFESYNHPRSKDDFYKFLTKLFETSKSTNVLAINGDVHKAMISGWVDKNSNFCELTSSAITRCARNTIMIDSKVFWGSYALDTIFQGKGINDYKVDHKTITYGNNAMIAELLENKVKTTTYCCGPKGYFESFLIQLGLKSFPEDVTEVNSEYDYITGDIMFTD